MAARVAAVIVMVAVGLGLTATAASAHATLESSSPEQSAVYPAGAPPSAVSLRFDEAVTATRATISLYDGSGREVRLTEKPVTSKTITAKLPRIPDGGYVVVWHVVSDDGHPEQGAFTFAVGKGAVTTADIGGLLAGRSSGRAIGVGFGVDRFMAFLSCLVFVGALVFLRWFWPAALARRRLRRALLVVGGTAIVATLLSVPFEAMYTTGGGYAHFFDWSAIHPVLDARFGRAALVRAALVMTLLPFVMLVDTKLRRRNHEPASLTPGMAPVSDASSKWSSRLAVEVVVAFLALGVWATFAYGGHGDTGRLVVLGFAIDMTHLGAAAIWLGGVVALVFAMRDREHTTDNAVAASRFTRIGIIAIGVLVASGVTQGWRQLETWSALWHTDYGRLLVVKVLVVVAIVIVASASRDVLRDRIVPRLRGVVHAGSTSAPFEDDAMLQLRNSIWAEVILAVAVLGVTAALVVTAPGREVLATADRPVARTLHADTTSRRVHYALAVQPAVAGQNTIVITPRLVSGASGFLPSSLTARVHGTSAKASASVTFTPLDDGRWVATAMLPSSGNWRVDLTGTAPPSTDTASAEVRIG